MAKYDILYKKVVEQGEEKPVMLGGEETPVMLGLLTTKDIHLMVLNVDFGFLVALSGKQRHFLKWFKVMDKAVEFGVQKAQEYIENGIPILDNDEN